MLVLAAGLGAGAPARAQLADPAALAELTLEELSEIPVETVFGASRFAQKTTQAPSAVTIVHRDELRALGHRTLVDTLNGVRGLHVSFDRTYHYLGSRGFARPGDYNSRTLFLVDGHRFNDNIYDGAVLDHGFAVDLDLVERVEIVRGPSSSLYGNSAFFGVVNVVTRRGRDLAGGELAGSFGSFGTWQARATMGQRLGDRAEVLLSATAYESDGSDRLFFPEFRDSPAGGRPLGTDYGRARSAFARLHAGNFSFEGYFVTRRKGIPTGSFGTVFGDNRTNGVDERGTLRLGWQRPVRPDLHLSAQVAYEVYNYDGTYRFAPADYGLPGPDDLTVKDYADGRAVVAEFVGTHTIDGRHTVVAGFAAQRNLRQDQGNFVESPRLVNFADTHRSFTVSPFAQADVALGRHLILNLGLRHDYFSTFGNTTNPRIAMIAQAAPATTIKLLYGRAFRAPNVYELRYNDGNNTFKANPGLQPERIASTELVFEQLIGRHWRATANVYRYDIDDLVDLVTDPADGLITFRNLDSVRGTGAELELEGRFHERWTGRVAYSWHDSRDAATDRVLTNSARHLVKSAAVLHLPAGLGSAGLEAQFTSSRRTLADQRTGGFWLVHANLVSREFAGGLRASVSVRNLLDRRYADPGGDEQQVDRIAQDGRTIQAKLEWRF
jgi:outer membrane receptor for ferrienterochelin and colicins